MLDKIFQIVRAHLTVKIIEKGSGAFVSTHEIYGVIAEEFEKELLDALHANNRKQFVRELLDVAASAIYGLASFDAGAVEK